MREVVLAFGKEAFEIVGGEGTFNPFDPNVEKAIEDIARRAAEELNGTTFSMIADEVQEVLRQANREGWGIREIQNALRERVAAVYNMRMSDYQLERIARTEMNRAANMGKLTGFKQSGIPVKKAWIAALDDRTRETHIEAHSIYAENPIAIDEYFIVGADRMLHPGGGTIARENINCRCTMIAIVS